jgi:hypothetical protein
MNQEDGFGAVVCLNERVKLEIRSILTVLSPGNTLAQAVQQRMAWGAFHMTGCRERQVRGKGLACHFLQIVPTCL